MGKLPYKKKLGQFRSPGAEKYFLRKKNMDRSIDLAVQHIGREKDCLQGTQLSKVWHRDSEALRCLLWGQRSQTKGGVRQKAGGAVRRLARRWQQSLCLLGIQVGCQILWSSFDNALCRFVTQARDLGIPIAVVNIGPTRADSIVDLKIEAKAGDVLPKISLWPWFKPTQENTFY